MEGPGPLEGPFPLTGGRPLTGLTGRPPYGKLLGEERSLREGRVLTEGWGSFTGQDDEEGWTLTGSPLRGGTVLTGRAGPYGAGSLHREERPLITGKLTGSYGEGLYQNWAGISACVP